MVLKLGGLHLLDRLELDLGHVVLVHVKKDVLDHDDAKLLVGPQFVEGFDEVFIGSLEQVLSHGLE